MELDDVAAEALLIEDSQLGRILVGEPSLLDQLGRAPAPRERPERRHLAPGAVRLDGILERTVIGEQVDVLIGRRLVENLVRVEAGLDRHG